MRNTLGDLNNHLFAQLERLSDEDLKGEALAEEVTRAKAVACISSQIINNGNLIVKGIMMQNDHGIQSELPHYLEG